MSVAPSELGSFQAWLEQGDALTFLQQNTVDDELVLYANMQNIYIHALLVPANLVDPPNIDDLMRWNCNAYSSWSVTARFHPSPSIAITPPLVGTGSATFEQGEQLVFAREFVGHVGETHYTEILQKFIHVSDIHYVPEKNAYCRLDRHGDVEEIVRLIKLRGSGQMFGGTIVTVKRKVLDRYATLTDAAIVRTFDFTRVRPSQFSVWQNSHDDGVTELGDLFFRKHVETGYASYMRGCQIIRSQISKDIIMDEFDSGSQKDGRYAPL